VKNGQKIKLKGRGGPGRNGGPHGDLIVEVDVAEHSVFGRKGNNLTIDVPVTYAEAALGAPLSVPTIDGSSVRLKMPPGTPSGKTFRVKGRGVTAGTKTGDLLVTVNVIVPTTLSDSERDAIEKLAEVGTVADRDRLYRAASGGE
jgi:molecular chaperone DnaJ